MKKIRTGLWFGLMILMLATMAVTVTAEEPAEESVQETTPKPGEYVETGGKLYKIAKDGKAKLYTGIHDKKGYKKGLPVNGWLTIGKKQYYCKKGVLQKGRQKTGKTWSYLKANGVRATKDIKADKAVYYIDRYKHLEAYKKGKTYYKPNGKKMAYAQREDYITLRRARAIVKKITKKKMTKKQKLKKCFDYVIKFPYRQYRSFPARNKAWASIYANDHFVRGGGDCRSDATAFAYLARAVGYKDVYVCLDAHLAHPNHHSWTYVNGRYYDPLFAQAKNYGSYWAAKNYPLGTIVKTRVAVGYVGNK